MAGIFYVSCYINNNIQGVANGQNLTTLPKQSHSTLTSAVQNLHYSRSNYSN